jgi:hypothetical protein
MPAKLTPEERERRRKERSKRAFSDAAYRHYDPNVEGFGSANQWKGTAEARLNVIPVVEINADLQLLGLDKLPASKRDLSRAYRLKSLSAHPDQGGSETAFQALTDAYERLQQQIKE